MMWTKAEDSVKLELTTLPMRPLALNKKAALLLTVLTVAAAVPSAHPSERWISPPEQPPPPPESFNTKIVKGVAVIDGTPTPTPAPAQREEPGKVKITGYPVDVSPSEIQAMVMAQSSEMLKKNLSAALPGDNRSLVAFYAVEGNGDRTLVKFSSKLSTPTSKETWTAMTIPVPSDGSPRIVPLFFGMEISPSTIAGQYSMEWIAEEVSSGDLARSEASFMKASEVGSANVSTKDKNWKGGAMPTPNSSFETKVKPRALPTPPAKFEHGGVGTKPKKDVQYKFETAPKPNVKPKKKDDFSFSPSPSPKKKKSNF
jgi:hypothetical protein